MLRIVPVDDDRALRRFIRLPWRIYRGNSCWVPPLLAEQRRTLSPAHNPFFQHSHARLFLAERGGETVARIAAIENRRHLEVYADGTGFFGFFECVDDLQAARALVGAAADWVRERGLARLRGPTSFTINDECGLLLDAFDRPPVLLMPYNPPYYPALLEACGFEKAQDLLAYRYDVLPETPPGLVEARQRVEGNGIRIRNVDLSRFDEELTRLHAVHSAAWAENWGAVPLSREEIRLLAKALLPVIDPELVFLAEENGETVGVSVTLPDFNQALRHLGGRLLPVGWAKLWWHRRRIDAVRVLIMGVLRSHRHRGIDAAFYARMLEAARRKGYRWGELSWILESNLPMRRVLAGLGATVYKTYRIYDRPA
jgi:GNAT superfamily N-acetyltransferase